MKLTCQFCWVLVCGGLVLGLNLGNVRGQGPELLTPDWSMVLDEYGYSDWAYDQRAGYEYREYLSGEWAAAISYNSQGTDVGPNWLNPQFGYPDWSAQSGFWVETEFTQLETNRYGFHPVRTVISDGSVRVALTNEMVDTTNGVPQGLSPRSSPNGASTRSSRYVLRQSFSITNITSANLVGMKFYKFLHALEASRAVYDDRSYGPTFNGHHYTITQQGVDYYWGSGSMPAVHWDTVALHANRAPSSWEIGRYGIAGIDDHAAAAKPSVGVHLSVEAGSLSGVDSIGPTNPWVSGALSFDLGSLAPNASTNLEFLMSLGTITTVKSLGVVAWGNNSSGQTRVPAGAMSNVVAIAAGANHSLALRSDGRVVAWGDNSCGQTNVPVGLSNVVSIAAGGRHSLAIRADGSVVAWGDNAAGQVSVPAGIAAQSVVGGDNHSVALLSSDSLQGWGSDAQGQLDFAFGFTPWQVAAGSNFTLVLGWGMSEMAGFGDNSAGQLNMAGGLSWPDEIAAGGSHGLAREFGTVAGWGSDSDGQIDVPAGLDARAIAAGGRHSMALNADGSIVCWGNNSFHQLEVPSGLAPAQAIAAGANHSLALVPVPPQLSITRLGATNIVSWSAVWAPEFEKVQLQQATSLKNPGWEEVTATGQIEGALYSVRLPLEHTNRFFRLSLEQ